MINFLYGHLENKNYYRDKIKSVIEYHLKNLKNVSHRSHGIQAYLNPNYNTLAMILTDKYAMVSIYRVAPGKTGVPHFIFGCGGEEYKKVYDDIQKILKLAREVSLE